MEGMGDFDLIEEESNEFNFDLENIRGYELVEDPTHKPAETAPQEDISVIQEITEALEQPEFILTDARDEEIESLPRVMVFDSPPEKSVGFYMDPSNPDYISDEDYWAELKAQLREEELKGEQKAEAPVADKTIEEPIPAETSDGKNPYGSYVRNFLKHGSIRKPEKKSKYEVEVERIQKMAEPYVPSLHGRRVFALDSLEIRNASPLGKGMDDVIGAVDILAQRRQDKGRTRRWYDSLSIRPFRKLISEEWIDALSKDREFPVSILETEPFVYTQSNNLYRRFTDSVSHYMDAIWGNSSISPPRAFRDVLDELFIHPGHAHSALILNLYARMFPNAILVADSFEEAEFFRKKFGLDRKIAVRFSARLDAGPREVTFIAQRAGYKLSLDPLDIKEGVPAKGSISVRGMPVREGMYTLEETFNTIRPALEIIDIKGDPNNIVDFKRELTRTVRGDLETDLAKVVDAVRSPHYNGFYLVHIDPLNEQIFNMKRDLGVAVEASVFLSETFGPNSTSREEKKKLQKA